MGDTSKVENVNIMMYRRVLPCPLRSQIDQVKARMNQGMVSTASTEAANLMYSTQDGGGGKTASRK